MNDVEYLIKVVLRARNEMKPVLDRAAAQISEFRLKAEAASAGLAGVNKEVTSLNNRVSSFANKVDDLRGKGLSLDQVISKVVVNEESMARSTERVTNKLTEQADAIHDALEASKERNEAITKTQALQKTLAEVEKEHGETLRKNNIVIRASSEEVKKLANARGADQKAVLDAEDAEKKLRTAYERTQDARAKLVKEMPDRALPQGSRRKDIYWETLKQDHKEYHDQLLAAFDAEDLAQAKHAEAEDRIAVHRQRNAALHIEAQIETIIAQRHAIDGEGNLKEAIDYTTASIEEANTVSKERVRSMDTEHRSRERILGDMQEEFDLYRGINAEKEKEETISKKKTQAPRPKKRPTGKPASEFDQFVPEGESFTMDDDIDTSGGDIFGLSGGAPRKDEEAFAKRAEQRRKKAEDSIRSLTERWQEHRSSLKPVFDEYRKGDIDLRTLVTHIDEYIKRIGEFTREAARISDPRATKFVTDLQKTLQTVEGAKERVQALPEDRKLGVTYAADESHEPAISKIEAREADIFVKQEAEKRSAIKKTVVEKEHSVHAEKDVKEAVEDAGRAFRRAKHDVDQYDHSLSALTNGLKGFTRNVNSSHESVAALDNRLRGLLLLAVLAFAQQLITVLVGLVGALGAVASSAVFAAGALGGTLVAGIAQALPMVGLLVAAFARVKSVMDVVKQAQLVDQQRYGRQAADQKKVADTTDAVANATDGLKAAEDRVGEAHRNVTDKVKALAKAREDAKQQLNDLIDAEQSAELAARGAAISQGEAQDSLREAIRGGDVSGLDSAQLRVLEVGQQHAKALDDLDKARHDRAKAQRQGVSGNEGVVKAKQDLQDAKKAVGDAEKAVDKAQRGIEKARRGANAAATDAFAGAEKLDYLLKQLSPAERKLYDSMQRIRETYKKNFRPITDIFINEFTRGVDTANKLLKDKRVIGSAKDMATGIAGQMGRVRREFTSDKMIDQFVRIFRAGRKNLKPLTDFFIDIGHALANIAEEASPALHRVIDWFAGLASNIRGVTEQQGRMTKFFDRGATNLIAWLNSMREIVKLFFALADIGESTGLKSIEDLGKWADDTRGKVEQNRGAVHKFFEDSRQTLGTVLKVVGALAKAIIDVFDADKITSFGDFLIKTVIPALSDAVKFAGMFTSALFRLLALPGINTLTRVVITLLLLTKIASSSVTALAGVAQAFGKVFAIAERLGGTKVTSFFNLVALGAANAAKSVGGLLAKIPGLKAIGESLSGWAKKIETRVAETGTARAAAGATPAAEIEGALEAGGTSVAAKIEAALATGGSKAGASLATSGTAAGIAIKEEEALGGVEAGAAINKAMVEGGAEAAAEIRAGEIEGGGVAAGENALGNAAGGKGGLLKRLLGRGGAAAEEGAAAESGGIMGALRGIATRLGPIAARVAPIAGAATALGIIANNLIKPDSTGGSKDRFGNHADEVAFHAFNIDPKKASGEQLAWSLKTANSALDENKDKLKLAQDQLQKWIDAGGTVDDVFGKKFKAVRDDLQKTVDAEKDFVKDSRAQLDSRVKSVLDRTRGNFDGMRISTRAHLKNITDATRENMTLIASELGTKSAKGKQALAQNFQDAAKQVKKSMDAGLISTKTGLDEIDKLMSKRLQLYGFTKAEAHKFNQITDVETKRGKAVGGWADRARGWVGNAGERGRDLVNTWLGRGEYVLNWGKQKYLKARYGVDFKDLERIKGYHAGGYEQPGYASGGFVNNVGAHIDTPGERGIAAGLEKLGRFLKILFSPAGPRSARRTPAENAAVDGSPTSNHLRGLAMDVAPEAIKTIANTVLNRFGLNRPMSGSWTGSYTHDERNHIELLRGGGAGGAVPSGGAAGAGAASTPFHKLRRLETALGGSLGANVQGTIDLYEAAMNRVLKQAHDKSAANASEASGGGYSVNVKSSGPVARQLIQVWRQMSLPFKALLSAFETGIVESGMKNLSGGDADSAGWRQERASIYPDPTNVNHSAQRYYREWKGFNRTGLTAGQVAANVQRPRAEFRGRYDQAKAAAIHLLQGFGIKIPDAASRFATGGAIPGYGGGDQHPILTEGGEHVWTKDEVARAGGHSVMFALRRFFGGGTQGGPHGYASGGRVLDIGDSLSATKEFQRALSKALGGAVKSIAVPGKSSLWGLDQLGANFKKAFKTVVWDLGTNDGTTGLFERSLRKAYKKVHAAGSDFVLPTLSGTKGNINRQEKNDFIRQFAKTHSDVTVVAINKMVRSGQIKTSDEYGHVYGAEAEKRARAIAGGVKSGGDNTLSKGGDPASSFRYTAGISGGLTGQNAWRQFALDRLFTTATNRQRIADIGRGDYELPELPIRTWSTAMKESRRAMRALKNVGSAWQARMQAIVKEIQFVKDQPSQTRADKAHLKDLATEYNQLLLNTRGVRGLAVRRTRANDLTNITKDGGVLDQMNTARERMTAGLERGLTFATYKLKKYGEGLKSWRVKMGQTPVGQTDDALNVARKELTSIITQEGVVTKTREAIQKRLAKLRGGKGGVTQSESEEVQRLETQLSKIDQDYQSIRDAHAQQIAAVYEAQVAAQEARINKVNSTADTGQARLGIMKRINDQIQSPEAAYRIAVWTKQLLTTQADGLQKEIARAKAMGNTELATQLETQVTDLRTQIWELAQQNVRDAAEFVNNAAQRKIGNLDRVDRMLNALGSVGLAGAAATVGGTTLTRAGVMAARGDALATQLAGITKIRDDTLANPETATNNKLLSELNDQIEELTVNIAENSKALFDARVTAVNETASRLGGNIDLNKRIVELNGQISGTTDNAALIDLENQRKQVLKDQADSLNKLLDEAVAGGDQQAVNDLTTQLLQNQVATLENTVAINDLNGTTSQPQTFSSSAWQWFREAIFTGMGDVMPNYVVPGAATGGIVTKSGLAMVHAGEPIIPAEIASSEFGNNTGDHNEYHFHAIDGKIDMTEFAATAAWAKKTAQG